MVVCITPGKKNASRHAVKLVAWKLSLINWYTRGMISWVAPPPKLPHPAAIAFADPTILLLNMELIQYWQDTNVARENPMKNRTAVNPDDDSTDAMAYTAGEMIITRNAHPYRGPIKSHTDPISRRERIEPAVSKHGCTFIEASEFKSQPNGINNAKSYT